jgi:hypothetical protein
MDLAQCCHGAESGGSFAPHYVFRSRSLPKDMQYAYTSFVVILSMQNGSTREPNLVENEFIHVGRQAQTMKPDPSSTT